MWFIFLPADGKKCLQYYAQLDIYVCNEWQANPINEISPHLGWWLSVLLTHQSHAPIYHLAHARHTVYNKEKTTSTLWNAFQAGTTPIRDLKQWCRNWSCHEISDFVSYCSYHVRSQEYVKEKGCLGQAGTVTGTLCTNVYIINARYIVLCLESHGKNAPVSVTSPSLNGKLPYVQEIHT